MLYGSDEVILTEMPLSTPKKESVTDAIEEPVIIMQHTKVLNLTSITRCRGTCANCITAT